MSVRVSTLVWERSSLQGAPFLLMLALADQANDEGWCWPKQTTLARRLRLQTTRGVRMLVQKCVDAGELQVVHKTHEKRYTGNYYRIRLDALAQRDSIWDKDVEEGGEDPPAPQIPTIGTNVPLVTDAGLTTGTNVPHTTGTNVPHTTGTNVPVYNRHNNPNNNRKEKDMSPDGDASPKPPTASAGGKTKAPDPVTGSPSARKKTPTSQNDKEPTVENVSRAAALVAVYNAHRGPLPAASKLTPLRVKALCKLADELGEDTLSMLMDATREVAQNKWWLDNRYGLNNLLSDGGEKVVKHAEAYSARPKLDAAEPPRRNYDDD